MKYRLKKLEGNVYSDDEKKEGPFIITIKNMSGDLLVLSTGDELGVNYDEGSDTLLKLYQMIAENQGLSKYTTKIKLLDPESGGEEITQSVFNYLDNNYIKKRELDKFHCGKRSSYIKTNIYNVSTPLPKKNLSLFLLIEE